MIDYLDGTLSVEREAELLLFLENNPTIKAELEGLDEMILSEVDAVFECRDCLKKSILDSSLVNDDNFENFCIASIEGDLSALEEENLKNYLHDRPTKKAIYNQYAHLKLQPSENHVVGEKLSLYHLATQSNETVNKDNYLDFVIARNEGDLNALQIENLELFIQENPQLAKEIQAFEKLKLQSDTYIVYEDKASLKRRKIGFALPYAWVNTAAASVAIFLFFYFIIPNKPWSDVKNQDSISTTDTSIYQEDINIENPKEQEHYTITEEVQHKPKSTKKTTTAIRKKSIAKNPKPQVRENIVIARVAPKTCEGVAISNTNLPVIEEQNFPIEILKPVVEEEEKIAEVNQERTYEVNGIAGKIIAKLSKAFGKEEKKGKDRERSNIKEQLMAVADYAVEGFNRMTEADISLPSSRRDKPKE
ncbi:MAG: hypothetical protein DSY76_03035 [Bacteroidetes bacterium]|nr:MAG: hypothetical protein DSY76_03035 [Bacteroidota bacterium]